MVRHCYGGEKRGKKWREMCLMMGERCSLAAWIPYPGVNKEAHTSQCG